MSNHRKQPYATMEYTARLLVAKLEPACQRIEIAGSIRRRSPMVSDIEIVAVPIPIPNLIGEPTENTILDELLDTLPLTFTKRGRRFQQFSFDGTTAPFHVDLFLQPDPATWGVNMMIRTGSADFARRMMTARSSGGFKPDWATVKDARVWRAGVALPTPEEKDLFELWGMEYVRPEDRN